MNMTWLMRMARWARRPPSMRQVRIVAVVIAVVLVIAGLEWLGLWPDWATVEPRGGRLPRLN
ncbi:hypothetical protein P0X85_09125 [Defluviimonas nitratireducens]|nr:hypothetical protein [Defluviimonas nitratireducens]MDF1620677.1 hypothetical protein [Defluviimonas nitratireducens]